jgi:predicted ATPase/class 3 adenylate cyclase
MPQNSVGKKCAVCGASNRFSAKYCSGCGRSLPRICPHCGETVLEKVRFCDQCGKPLDVIQETADKTETASKEIPDIIKKKISYLDHIAGERRVITVMFADVAGFTALSQQADPEEISALMNRCFEIMAKEIYRMDGVINKYLGDGLMALYGAPIAHEDHAIRAALSALNIQKAMLPLAEETKQKWDKDFKLRIGINTGEVVTGKIGNDYQMEYTAMGDTINLASRIEGQAEPGTVAISGNTYQRVKYFFDFEHLGEKQIKGVQEPVPIYKVLRRQKRKSAIDLSTPAMLSPFIGRETEMETLAKLVGKSRNGNGQIAVINAEPGLGKSRLLYEMKCILMQQDATYLEGRCISYGQNIAFLPIMDMTKDYFFKGEDSPDKIKPILEEGLAELGFSPKDISPYLLNLFSIPIDDPEFLKQDQETVGRKTFDILKALIVRAARDRLLVIVVEDLQWVDNSSEKLLSDVASMAENLGALLVCTSRPTYEIKWTSLRNFNLINLKELSMETSRELLSCSFEKKEVSDDMASMILQKSEGNPFFIEEFANALKDFEKTKDVTIPFSIQDIIMSRLDRLNEQSKRVILIAGVIGRDFSLRLLQSVAGNDIKYALQELTDNSLIYEKSSYPETEYAFKHALIQEIAYRSILGPRKKAYHLNIASALEEIHESRIEEKCEAIAFHYENSNDSEQAIKYLVMAGAKMARIFANIEAESYYDRAVKLSSAQPKTKENIERLIDVNLAKFSVTYYFHYSEKERALLSELGNLACSIQDNIRLAWIYNWMGKFCYVEGDQQNLISHFTKCLELSKNVDIPELRAWPINVLGRSKFFIGDLDGADKYLSEGIGLMEKIHNKSEQSHSAYLLACLRYLRGGRKDECLSLFRDAYKWAEESKDAVRISLCMMCHGMMVNFCEGPREAAALQEKGLEIAQKANNHFAVYLESGNSVLSLLRAGLTDKALENGETAIDLSKKYNFNLNVSYIYATTGLAHLALGGTETAEKYSDKAFHLALEMKDTLGTIFSGTLKGILEMKKSGEKNRNSMIYFENVRSFLRDKRLIIYEPILDCYIATACRDAGDVERFKTHIESAIEGFRKLEMNWDVENALTLKTSFLGR